MSNRTSATDADVVNPNPIRRNRDEATEASDALQFLALNKEQEDDLLRHVS